MLGLWLPAPSSSSRRSPGLADSQHTSAEAGPASPLPHPQTLHAARAACHRLAGPQSGRDWKGLKTAVKPGKLTSVLQPLPVVLCAVLVLCAVPQPPPQSPPQHLPLLPLQKKWNRAQDRPGTHSCRLWPAWGSVKYSEPFSTTS